MLCSFNELWQAAVFAKLFQFVRVFRIYQLQQSLDKSIIFLHRNLVPYFSRSVQSVKCLVGGWGLFCIQRNALNSDKMWNSKIVWTLALTLRANYSNSWIWDKIAAADLLHIQICYCCFGCFFCKLKYFCWHDYGYYAILLQKVLKTLIIENEPHSKRNFIQNYMFIVAFRNVFIYKLNC